MLKLAVLVSGGGTNLQALIDQIEQKKLTDVKIEVVISNKKDVYALERAKQHGIPTETVIKKDYENQTQFEDDLLARLNRYQVDLIVLAGCLMILPEIIIRNYRNRIINIHPSLIPSFCGAGFYGLKVHEAVLARGVKVTGATVHFVDEGCDTGPIILQKAVMVEEDDTPEILQRRVMEQAEWLILPEAVRLIAQNRIKVENNIVKIIN
ncbi:phosphoribosylglycinamide formyltransferase [Lachnospiraceae bacterium MD1]|jgi:phosphoribosylglycinamide formyltransferase-1|uniref:Phosphoribosylglycinamide formyltransferase n=1 Tax=Variimorphobacter saccharofermentans TaxID=2755051 RepID=A0A839K2K7_9FIRM|nr:phosphoribosylglycinamide formyltransferase [Variimorphobacter saccharofermentans]MBB2184153.1 phosphoribosylglycinamide formyltransferase [Variimorphobacter saccharofermentans]